MRLSASPGQFSVAMEAFQTYLYTRGFAGGLDWTRVVCEDSRLERETPDGVEVLYRLIDQEAPALVVAVIDTRLVLLIWNLACRRQANGGRIVSTSMMLSWDRGNPVAVSEASSFAAELLASSACINGNLSAASNADPRAPKYVIESGQWLDIERISNLASLFDECIVDPLIALGDRVRVIQDFSPNVEHPISYAITREFCPTLEAIIKKAVDETATQSHTSRQRIQSVSDKSTSSLVVPNDSHYRGWLATELQANGLPERLLFDERPALIVVTNLKLPVDGVWRMLTSMIDRRPLYESTAKESRERFPSLFASAKLAMQTVRQHATSIIENRIPRRGSKSNRQPRNRSVPNSDKVD